MKRPDYEIALIDRVLPRMSSLLDELFPGADKTEPGPPVTVEMIDALTDEQALVAACNMFAREAYAASTPYHERKQVCGWCVRAAGDTQEAAEAAVVYSLDDIKTHTLTCDQNPLVKKLAEIRAALHEACEITTSLTRNKPASEEMEHLAEMVATWRSLSEVTP